MKSRRLSSLFLLLASCSTFTGDDSRDVGSEEPDASAPLGDGGTPADGSVVMPPDVVSDQDAGTGVSPPAVDELTEAYGVFVSLTGSLDGDGTRKAPLSTINAGIARAKKDGKRVYVCKGTYKESLELQSGVSIFGGYTCATSWQRIDGEYSLVESPTSPAIRASNIVNATTFLGFDVIAPDAVSAAEPSSIGLIADKATALVVADSKITAGKGLDGAPGVEPAAPVPGTGIDGAPGKVSFKHKPPPEYPEKFPGGTGGTSQCGGGAGGRGADGAVSVCTKESKGGFVLFNYVPLPECYEAVPRLNQPPLWTVVGDCSEGQPQTLTATPGMGGVNGFSAGSIGALSKTGYAPADGSAGTSGMPGVGGSGGKAQSGSASTDMCDLASDSRTSNLASGAGGGAGGCGGIAGTPGKGGGASIAALVWISPGLVFDGTELVASKGGAGGKGSLGAAPTAGGKAGVTAPGAYDASDGGDGGIPGVSGSGAGGPSFGIAVHGPAPKLVNGSLAKPGTPGSGVPEESKSFGAKKWTLQESAAGLSKDIYEF